MNNIVTQQDLFPFNRLWGKYHLITDCSDSGQDDKDYVNTLEEAKSLACQYLKGDNFTFPYDTVYVFNELNNELILVFDEYSKNGRKPTTSDLGHFNT